jgi:hypothetical protein
VPFVAQYQTSTLCPYSLNYYPKNKGIRAEEDWVIVVATKVVQLGKLGRNEVFST